MESEKVRRHDRKECWVEDGGWDLPYGEEEGLNGQHDRIRRWWCAGGVLPKPRPPVTHMEGSVSSKTLFWIGAWVPMRGAWSESSMFRSRSRGIVEERVCAERGVDCCSSQIKVTLLSPAVRPGRGGAGSAVSAIGIYWRAGKDVGEDALGSRSSW